WCCNESGSGRRERTFDPTHDTFGLPRRHLPGDEEQPPAQRDELRESLTILAERSPAVVVLPPVALERQLLWQPSEVEPVAAARRRHPMLACGRRESRATQREPHLGFEPRLERHGSSPVAKERVEPAGPRSPRAPQGPESRFQMFGLDESAHD